MFGNRIRISFAEGYPYVNGKCSRMPHFRVGSSCPMPGIAVEIIALITNYLNLTVDVVQAMNFNDAYDDLYNGKTDLVSWFFVNTSARKTKFDFTKKLYSTNIKVVVKRADNSLKNIFEFFNVYQWDVWIGISAVFVLFTVFGLFVRYIERRLALRESCNFSEILWKMVRFQLIQPEWIDYMCIAGKSSLLVFSIFQICIILGLFQGFILTNIVKKVDPIPFNGREFPQLIAKKKLTITKAFSFVHWVYQEIETSYESPFYQLRDSLKVNPYKFVKTIEDLMQEIGEGHGAVSLFEEYWWYKDWAEKYCNLILVDVEFLPKLRRFMFKKGSRFVPLFNGAIDMNKYQIERITRKYWQYRPPSKCKVKRDAEPAPLSMAPYYGLLILFFAGISTAVFVFSGELLRWRVS